MPIIHEETNVRGTRVQVWSIEEDLSYFTSRLSLSNGEADWLSEMHPRRALEWAASRYMLHTQTDLTVPFSCLYDAHGRPYIPGADDNISISHSHGMAAIALSKSEVGVDIQVRTEKVTRIRHKFVSPDEDDRITGADAIAKLHLCWSAKEALYKAWARRQLEFREHISVAIPNVLGKSGQTTGMIEKDGKFMRCDLFYTFVDQHVLVYAIQRSLP